MITSDELKSRFSKAATTYDRHAGIHRKVAKHLVECSTLPQNGTHILELGAGTGALTSEIRKQYDQRQIICLDISRESLEVLRIKHPEVHCIQADFQYLPFTTNFPLVVSSTAMQWANDASAIRNILLHTLEENGTFAISVVMKGTFSLLRDIKMRLFPESTSKALPCFNVLKSLFNINPLVLEFAETKNYFDYFKSVEEVFLSIKGLGVGAHGGAPLSPVSLATLKSEYQLECNKGCSKPFLEYTIGFFVGKRR